MTARMPDAALPWPIPMAAVELIAEREGCRLRAYRCPAGIWTCGWGETAGVLPTTAWTQQQADQQLCDSLTKLTGRVLALCTEHPTDNQLGALVSLAYNIGVKALAGSSVLKAHNRGDWQAASRAFGLWNKATVDGRLQVLAGLTARRAAEAALYLKPEDEAPQQAMPQAVAAESSMARSPIAQSGAVTAGAGVLAAVNQAGDQLGTVSSTVQQAKTIATETLGVPADWFLPALLVAAGAVVCWMRYSQRKEGWA